jgi:hypothetical protein
MHAPKHLRGGMVIRFGMQLGGGNSHKKIQPIYLSLNEIFEDSQIPYFKTIENFVIIFRVEGPISKFGKEGPDRLEYIKKTRELGIDFVVSEDIWKQRESNELKTYFSQAIRDSFNILLENAMKWGFVNNKERLVEDFNTKIEEFECLTFDDKTE